MRWTSRRRVEVALAHCEPDRVPVDMTITEVAYLGLREHLGLPRENDLRVSAFTEVRPALDVLGALGIDITYVQLRSTGSGTPQKPLDDGSVFDEWGVGRKRVELAGGAHLMEATHAPLREAGIADLSDYHWPDPHDPRRVAGLGEEARRIYEDTELAIMGRFGGSILEQTGYLLGWERFLTALVSERELVWKLLNLVADIMIDLDRAGLQAAGPYLSIFKLSGEDLGMQDRPLFSPRTWRGLIRPVLERRWRAARVALDAVGSHASLLLHSDGSFPGFIPELIECGIQALDPIQANCPGMELPSLKSRFGHQLTFHGGVDTQHVLPRGNSGDVVEEVKRCIATLGHGGGYILAPVHNVQADVPPENLVAMAEAVERYGRYPLTL
jgi:uroporphyrinogen decarboxylase